MYTIIRITETNKINLGKQANLCRPNAKKKKKALEDTRSKGVAF